MARLTNAQLVDELTRLRNHCEHLERRIHELSTKPSAPRATATGAVVRTYTRGDGVVMHKVRTGFNTFVHRAAH